MIVLWQIIIHLVEALHDKHVIAAQSHDPARKPDVDAWHAIDSLVWIMVHALIGKLSGDWTYAATGLAIRLALLQLALNHYRGLPLSHLGSGTIDRLTLRIVGQRGSVCLKFLILILCLSYAFL